MAVWISHRAWPCRNADLPSGWGRCVKDGVTAVDIQGLSTQNLTAGDFAGALRIISAGDAYVNVHTTSFPAGEIRGLVRSGD